VLIEKEEGEHVEEGRKRASLPASTARGRTHRGDERMQISRTQQTPKQGSMNRRKGRDSCDLMKQGKDESRGETVLESGGFWGRRGREKWE